MSEQPTIPHAERVEYELLAAMFERPEDCIPRAVADGLTVDSFYIEKHQILFREFTGRINRGDAIDWASLCDELPEPTIEMLGGQSALSEWSRHCQGIGQWGGWVKSLRENQARREMFHDANAKLALSLTGAPEDIPGLRSKGFSWSIESAGDVWTSDPEEIADLSDRTIIEGMLKEREVATIVGGAKTLKTWFSLRLALAAAAETEFLGRAVNNCRVLYLDYELKRETFKRRLSMLAENRPENFDFQTLRGARRLPTPEEIGKLIKEKGYKLIVIDSLYRTGWLGEENSNDSTGRELAILQTLAETEGVTILVVDHTAKGGGREQMAVDAARGASAKGGFFDALFVLRPQESAEPGEHRAVLDLVLRDWPAPPELPVISYGFTATTCRMTLAGTADPSDLKGTRQRVFEVVANAGDEGVTVDEAAKAIGKGAGAARNHLNALIADRGKVASFMDPKHRQKLRYRTPDLIDNHAEQNETAQNS